jgi:hypothetical protein
MRSFAACLAFAIVAETLIGRTASHSYSSAMLAILSVAWLFGSLVLAWFEPRRGFVYFGSVALSAPGISYSMLGYGLLIMGGFLQALCAGVYVLPFHYWFQRSRARRNPPAMNK